MLNSDESNKFLVLGMGNPLLCDDSIGLTIVERAEIELTEFGGYVEFKKNYCGGIDLLYDFIGVHKAIIVDSVQTENALPGHCHEFNLHALDHLIHDRLVYAHGVSLPTVIDLGRQCGYAMPHEVLIYGIESIDSTTFSTQPTLKVLQSMEHVVEKIERQLGIWIASANAGKQNATSTTKELA